MASINGDSNELDFAERVGRIEKCVLELKLEVGILVKQITKNTAAMQALQQELPATIAAEVCRVLNLHKTNDSHIQQNSPYVQANPSAEITSQHGDQHLLGREHNPININDPCSPLQRASTSKLPTAPKSKKNLFVVPKDVNIPFKITSAMEYDRTTIAVISYTFTLDKPLVEPLIATGNLDHVCSRQSLHSLAPSKFVAADVINAWVCYLTFKEKEIHVMNWFLPTTFAVRIQMGSLSVEEGLKKYRQNRTFMSTRIDKCYKIFIPMVTKTTMRKSDHWFLTVVDMKKKEVVYIDSAASRAHKKTRMDKIKLVVAYLQNLLAHPSFDHTSDYVTPNIADFEIVVPERVPQETELCDSAVWIMLWMDRLTGSEKLDIEMLDENHRLNILVELLMGSFNSLKDELINNATIDFCAKDLKECSTIMPFAK